jgi:hypothetical protein
MKQVYVLAFLIGLTGCGAVEQLGNGCNGEYEEACHSIFGGRTDRDQNTEIDNLKNKLAQLESSVVSIRQDIASQGVDLYALEMALFDAQNNNQAAVAGLQAQIDDAQNAMVTLQDDLGSAILSIGVLQGYNNIVSVLDPCGQQGLVANEVLLKLSNGTLLASFSDTAAGLNTRFAVLGNGTFVTSDGTSCFFTVTNGVLSNEHN